MAFQNLGSVTYQNSPNITATFSADVVRNGADITITPRVTMSAISSSSYFGYNIVCDVYVGNTQIVFGAGIKNSSPSQWSNPIVVTMASHRLANTGSSQAIRFVIKSTNGGSGSTDRSYTLTFTPALSSLGDVGNFQINGVIPIRITNYGMSDSLEVRIGHSVIKTINNIPTNYNLSFTANEQANIYNFIPNATSTLFTFVVVTRNGNTILGTSSKTATGMIPASIVPTCGAIGVSEVNEVLKTLGAGYVKGHSKLLITIGTSSGIHGSTISGYRISVDNQSFATQSATTDVIGSTGTLSITAVVTDSRGRTSNRVSTITVLDYSSPSIETAINRKDTTVTTMITTIKGSITSLNAKNTCTYTIRSKMRNDSSFVTKVDAVPLSGTNINVSREITGYDVTKAYDVQVIITDKLSSTTHHLILATDSIIMDYKRNGVGVGGYLDENVALKVHGDISVKDIYSNGQKVIPRTYIGDYTVWSGTATSSSNTFVQVGNATNVEQLCNQKFPLTPGLKRSYRLGCRYTDNFATGGQVGVRLGSTTFLFPNTWSSATGNQRSSFLDINPTAVGTSWSISTARQGVSTGTQTVYELFLMVYEE